MVRNPETTILTHRLTRRYGAFIAVDKLDLEIQRGEIFAFLGLNGAGKSTTIRMLLGMLRPDAGHVQVLGEAIRVGSSRIFSRVGHLVETASAYPELSVRENLEIHRRLMLVQDVNAVTRVMEKLDLVRLADKRASQLSLGNRQRLGLARALLHRPELLILDEPTNGLDPAGVVEIRDLLRSLARNEGITVFMSSHILSEVSRLADRIAILHHGRLIKECTSQELFHQLSERLAIEVLDKDRAMHVLRQAGFSPLELSISRLVLSEPEAVREPERIAALLVNAQAGLRHLSLEHQELEQHFLQLTSSQRGPELS